MIPAGSGMGEGSHFYHLNGRYYIFSANYDPMCYEVVARADRPEGPYEVHDDQCGGELWRRDRVAAEGLGREPRNPADPAAPR